MPPDPVKDFIKGLEKLERSFSVREKFRDLCEMAYVTFAKPMAQTPERAEALENRYMQIVNRYPDKDTIRAYPDLMGIALMAVQGGGMDFLGRVSGELEVLDAGAGQFFTPYDLSRMMAEMTFDNAGDLIEQQGYITIQEPAAGAGGMILAAADVLQGKGYDPTHTMLVHAVDISQLCYHMCFLQLTWRGIPAYVERANSLSLESFEGSYTLPALDFHDWHGHLFKREPREEAAEPTPTPEPIQPVNEQPAPDLVQLKMF